MLGLIHFQPTFRGNQPGCTPHPTAAYSVAGRADRESDLSSSHRATEIQSLPQTDRRDLLFSSWGIDTESLR